MRRRPACGAEAPSARRRPEYPAVSTVRACGWTPAAKARTPGLQAVPGSPRMALRGKPKGRGDSLWRGAVCGFSLNAIPAKGESPRAGLAQRVAEGMVKPGSDSGMRRRTAATPALNNHISCRPRNGPRLKAGVTVCGAAWSMHLNLLTSPRMSPLARLLRGDREWCGGAVCGFSPNVIPAKGEAREPGSMYQPVRDFDMDPGRCLLRGSSGVTGSGAARIGWQRNCFHLTGQGSMLTLWQA